MSSVIKGTLSPIFQGTTERYSPNSGYVTESEWRGFDADLMKVLAYQYAFAGCEYSYSFSNGVAVLRAVDNNRNITIDKWEVGLNKLSPSSLENPLNIANVLEQDLQVIAEFARGEHTFEEADDLLDPANGYAHRLLDRINKGSNAFYLDSYVLLHTTNVGNRYAVNVSDQNVGFLYTTAEMLNEVTDPVSWILPLPGRLVFKLQSVSNDLIGRYGAKPNYLWSWRKSGSAESSSANNRVDISTEYEFGQWSTDEYIAL